MAVSRQEKSHPSSSSSFGVDEGKVEMTESSEVDFEGFLTEESMRTGSTCTSRKRKKKGEVVEETGFEHVPVSQSLISPCPLQVAE